MSAKPRPNVWRCRLAVDATAVRVEGRRQPCSGTCWPPDAMRPRDGNDEETEGEEMRAVVHDRYGPPEVLRLEEVERPVPKDDEVLVKIHATTVNRSDCGLRSAEYFITRFFTGLLRPKRRILGSELAGEVEAVGAAVTEFEVGDRVFGMRARRARRLRLRPGERCAGAHAGRHDLRRGGGGLRRRARRTGRS